MELQHLCMGCMAEKGSVERCPHCGWVEGTRPESPLHLPPRTILNEKYLLGRVLGQGGFGITYLGWDLNLNLKLAIKEYLPQELASRAMGHSQVAAYTGTVSGEFEYGLDKFLQEARTLAQFDDHPNIVSVRDFFRANGTAYLVMSYLDGMDLKEYIAGQGDRLPFDRAISLIMPVLDALKEVHAVNILHRDVSPDNIFIKQNGQVILIDFGAARQAVSAKGHSLSIILKPGFAPEEQYRSKGVQGPWTDLYAVAATLYRITTGQMPPESLDRMAGDTLVPPSQLGVAISAGEEQALLKAMAVRAEDRFQSIKEFQDALLGKITVSQAVTAPPSGATWHISRDGARFGPYTWDRMVQMAGSGNIGPGDMVWNEGMDSWQSAAQVQGLMPAAAHPYSRSGHSISHQPAPVSWQPGPVPQEPAPVPQQPGPVSQRPAPVSQHPPSAYRQPDVQSVQAGEVPRSRSNKPLLIAIGAGLLIIVALVITTVVTGWPELVAWFDGALQGASPGQQIENLFPGEDQEIPEQDDGNLLPLQPDNKNTPDNEIDLEEGTTPGGTSPGAGWTPPEVIPPGGVTPPVNETGAFWSLDPKLVEFTVYNDGGFKMVIDYTPPGATIDVSLRISYFQDNDVMVYSLEDSGQLGEGTNNLTLNSDWSGYDLLQMGFHPGLCTVRAIIDGKEIASGKFTVEE